MPFLSRALKRTSLPTKFNFRNVTFPTQNSRWSQCEAPWTQSLLGGWAILLEAVLWSYCSSCVQAWGLGLPTWEWMLRTRNDVELSFETEGEEEGTSTSEYCVNCLKEFRVKRRPDLQCEFTTQAPKRQKTDITREPSHGDVFLMAEAQKKANFSSFGNHFHERSPLANNSSKPGQAKKLVIKNFKGEPCYRFLVWKRGVLTSCEWPSD